ncbi:DMT family transporter [Photobacterium toruni]|uniref:DMT family transporter n=1 Tax=Photobacterium toruni TaxID=1935446 RepID=A0ABU6L1T9_9GAMM|nr:DMT family transporter [Photobacterium toruni]
MILIIILAIASGMALSTQAAINGQLGEKIGIVKTSLITFGIATVITTLLILFFEPAQKSNLLTVPKWQLTGAFFGILYLIAMVASVPRVGIAVATVATIFGQMMMSMIIDTQGWLGNAPIALNPWRIAAMVCISIALFFIYKSNQAELER